MREGKFKKDFQKLMKMLEYLDECLKQANIDPRGWDERRKYETIKVIQQMQGNWVRLVKMWGGWLAAVAAFLFGLLAGTTK